MKPMDYLKVYNTFLYKRWRDILNQDINTFSENKFDDGEKYIKGGFVENKIKYDKPEKHEKKKMDL